MMTDISDRSVILRRGLLLRIDAELRKLESIRRANPETEHAPEPAAVAAPSADAAGESW